MDFNIVRLPTYKFKRTKNYLLFTPATIQEALLLHFNPVGWNLRNLRKYHGSEFQTIDIILKLQLQLFSGSKNKWGAFDSAKNHKRQRRKRQSVTAKREKSQTPKFV